MGISREVEVPVALARSFRLVGGRVGVSETAAKLVRHWQRTRKASGGSRRGFSSVSSAMNSVSG